MKDILRNPRVATLAVALGLGGLGLAGCGESSDENPRLTDLPAPAKVLLPGSRHEEIQQFGANTFSDYTSAGGIGPRLHKGARIIVDCVAIGR
jgi:ABC-type proline/glycine betaine transport system permease subunit